MNEVYWTCINQSSIFKKWSNPPARIKSSMTSLATSIIRPVTSRKSTASVKIKGKIVICDAFVKQATEQDLLANRIIEDSARKLKEENNCTRVHE